MGNGASTRHQGRVGDTAVVPADAHMCSSCPHTGTGPAATGSANVLVDGKPALRVTDEGIHQVCCGDGRWSAAEGAPYVLINSRRAHRRGDRTIHCGGTGRLAEGSSHVLVGDWGKASHHDDFTRSHRLEVRIVDEQSGAPITRAPFELIDSRGRVVSHGATDDDGNIVVKEITPGHYRVRLRDGWILT